jgi:hypothetical protein
MVSEASENGLFMIAHTHASGATVLPIDIQRHHDSDGVFGQFDIIDELLKDVEPLPLVFATPKPESPPTLPKPAENEDTGEDSRQAARVIVHQKRLRHTLLTDAIIIKYVDVHGPKWRELARSLGGRQAGFNDDIVRNRYIRVMKAIGTPYVPQRVRTETPRKPARPVERWTAKDDAHIRDGVRLFGPKWADVACHVGSSRTAQATRNRAHRIGLTLARAINT